MSSTSVPSITQLASGARGPRDGFTELLGIPDVMASMAKELQPKTLLIGLWYFLPQLIWIRIYCCYAGDSFEKIMRTSLVRLLGRQAGI